MINTIVSIQRTVERLALQSLYDQEDQASLLSKLARVTPPSPQGVAEKKFRLEWAWIHPVMKKWLAERQIQGVSGESMEFEWEKFEITMDTDRDAINSGAALVTVENTTPEIMKAFVDGKVMLAMGPIRNNDLTYDGADMFSVAHKGPNGVADVSNLITVPTRADASAPTIPEIRAEMVAARRRLLKNRLYRNTVVSSASVDKSLVAIARGDGVFDALESLRTEEDFDLGKNVFQGTFELIRDFAPVSGTENSWDLVYQDPAGWRPSIFVPVKEPGGIEFDTTQEFARGYIAYGAYAKYAVKAAWWQTAVRSKPA